MFRTVRPGSAAPDSAREADAKPGSGSGSAGAAKSDGGSRTTAFGVATSAPAPQAPERDSGSAGAGKPSAERDSGPAGADSVFARSAKSPGTDRPAAEEAGRPSAGRDSGSAGAAKPSAERDSASARADRAAGADRPASEEAGKASTEPGSGSAGAGERPAGRGSAGPSAESERTAVFRTVKPGSAPADSAKRSDEDRPLDAGRDSASAGAGKPSAERASGSAGAGNPSAERDSGSAGAGKPSAERASGSAERDSASAGAGKPSAERDSASAGAGKPSAERDSGSAGAGNPSAGRDSGSASAGKPSAERDSAPADAGKRSAEQNSGSAGAGKASGESERTAVFRTVKPGSAPAGSEAGAAEADERTAVFRAVKPGSGEDGKSAGQDPRAAAKAGPGTDEAGKKASTGSEPAEDSERTAVFRAVKPGSAEPTKAEPGSKSAPESEPGSGPDKRTAVFRTVKPGTRPADGGKPAGRDPRAAKPDASEAGSAPVAAAKGAAGPAKPAPSAPEARASTFVPLRADDAPAPAPAAPKPPAPAPQAPRLDPSERTTQQPLPPRPPLDMLADLTNNPPPPPTPLRTVVRRVKIYAPIVVLLAVVLAVVQLVRPLPAPRLVLTATSQYTFPGGAPDLPWPTEGQASMAAAGLGTIGSSGEQKPVPIASVTKSMTAYIIMRDHPFKKGEKGAMIDVDKTAETEGQKDKSDNESTLNTVKEGDKISEYDAIAALMIPSANNIARLLARWDSGSQEAFVKKMNDTAKQLGMTNTTYTDPSGLDATTVSTAEDQVKLGLKIVELDALVDITRKPSWTDQTGKNWPNWNRLVPYNESLGIKTGTTTKAGGNLLFAAYKKVGATNQLIVGAVLGQHKPPIIDTVIAASKNLLVATQKSLEGAPVVKKGDVVGYVDDGVGGRTKVVATADVQAVGWSSLTVDIKISDGGTKIPGTAKAGTAVGVLTVGDGASQVKVPVALQSELASPGIGSKLTRIG
ncbi:hypothetical protein ACGFY6_14950 [Streptomyces sp. NPDC048387]|uniref:hypothetical protein n=1 Tax=Streptomyces sp. NPDC048387 TaxID=3365542 RepID=UPI00371C210B